MNEKLLAYKDKGIEYWKGRSKLQKGIIIGSVALLVLLIVLFVIFGNRTNFVPLYTNLTMQETGQIKAILDDKGIQSEVSADGTIISVPETEVNTLKVELAAEGLPNSGRIDYASIKEGMGIGMTDNEFSVIERAAMQTELADLIRTIDGVRNANVMITLPEESVWLADDPDAASASIVIDTTPGFNLEQKQIRALYHLVSKSVPNLPIDNIVIMNSNFEYFEYDDENSVDSTLSVYEQQRKIKQDIEKDLTRQLQQMLGTLIGRDSVLVSVTTDIDFTKENRQEELVTPVDEENMEGIPISIERITETYEGTAGNEEGIAGTGDGIPAYPGVTGGDGNVQSERIEERINNDVNRIRRDIVESPYKIRDLGIQVMVEPPEGETTTPQQTIDAIEDILATIVRTSIDSSIADELTDEQIEQKIYVFSQPFNGKQQIELPTEPVIPMWMYIVGGVLLAIIILLVVLLLRKKKKEEIVEEIPEEPVPTEIPDLPDGDVGEIGMKRKQLEKLAREKPDEFAKLIRTWLIED